MTKTIQEILNEQREQSQINKVSEHRVAVTISNKEKMNDPVTRQNIINGNKKKIQDPKWRAKVKEANNNWTEERRQAYQNRDRSYTQEGSSWREAVAANNRARNSDPKFIEKVKSGLKAHYADPENARKIKERNLISNTNPEHIANRKKGIVEYWSDPERSFKARMARKRARAKPIVTPHGVFMNISIAADYIKEHKLLTNVMHRLREYIEDSLNNEYYHITLDEFDKIVKNDPKNPTKISNR